MKPLRVLVACEFSGIVRDAFAARGFDAWSCDIVPAKRNHSVQHIIADVLTVLDQGWDLMVAHPPCTYLSYAGTAHWNKPGRKAERDAAMRFFMACVNAPIPHICVENPFGLPCQEYRKPDQIINPFQFGHSRRKRTSLWLKNLPPLVPTEVVEPEPHAFVDRGNKKRHWVDSLPPGPTRQRIRSTTFQGIASAMAHQWGDFLINERQVAAA